VPELPEVEVVRRGLDQWVVGRTIAGVTVFNERAVRRHIGGPAHFADLLIGRTVMAAHRRGKYLWLPLDSGDVLIGHLGMSGQLLVQPASTPDELHLRVRLEFADGGSELRFVDQRTFGSLAVETDVDADAVVPPSIAHIAADPLDPIFDDEQFFAALRRRRTGVKRALLDQTLISGVGNIYADEALWRTPLHYARPTETLTRPVVTALVGHIRKVMNEALTVGGTSFDTLYVNVNGESGYFDRSLHVYGREGEPCARCGTPIRREPFMNRSSYTCPHCQPRPRRARW
jgi:formamidopyrimidine-DNA glycosylase